MKVLKFGAIWCPGCLVMRPRWKEIESELSWLETEYYDADESEDVVEKYKVKELPTFIFLNKKGEEICREKGEISKTKLIKLLEELKDK